MIGRRSLRLLKSKSLALGLAGALLLALAGGCGSEGAPQKAPEQKPPAKAPGQGNQQPGST